MRGRVIDITRDATRRRRIVVGLKRLWSFRLEILTMIARRLKNNTACPKTDSA